LEQSSTTNIKRQYPKTKEIKNYSVFFFPIVEKNTKQKTKQNQYKKKGTKKTQNTAHLLKTALFQF
jgi:hypothetical protein